MAINQIPLTEVINVDFNASSSIVANLKINNIAIFTKDTPIVSLTDDYAIYENASAIASDWGTNSEVYFQATKIFSQQPNIKNANGVLIVIPMQNTIATSGQFTSESILLRTSNFDSITNGAFKISVDGGSYVSISSLSFGTNPTVSHIASVINAGLTGKGASCSASGGNIIISSDTTGTSSSIALQSPTSGTDITGSLYLNVLSGTITAGTDAGGVETLQEAIVRTQSQVYYGGILTTFSITDNIVNLATYIQSLYKVLFYCKNNINLLDTGDFVDIFTAGLNYTKCLLHTIGTEQEARLMGSAYASRLLAVNYDALNSTLTMNLKDLIGVNPSSWTTTQITKAENIGVDIYGQFEGGVNKVKSHKNIDFIDSIINKIAFRSRLLVSYFNVLAGTSTKLAQTESGMNVIKKNLTDICNLFVANGYVASGRWTSPDTFGNVEDFMRNISENGYYIYSMSISQQDPTERKSRVAPIIQIAIKEAGAIHSGNIIINVNK